MTNSPSYQSSKSFSRHDLKSLSWFTFQQGYQKLLLPGQCLTSSLTHVYRWSQGFLKCCYFYLSTEQTSKVVSSCLLLVFQFVLLVLIQKLLSGRERDAVNFPDGLQDRVKQGKRSASHYRCLSTFQGGVKIGCAYFVISISSA